MAYHCGAPTRDGSACERHVREQGMRCHQHRALGGAALPPLRLAMRTIALEDPALTAGPAAWMSARDEIAAEHAAEWDTGGEAARGTAGDTRGETAEDGEEAGRRADAEEAREPFWTVARPHSRPTRILFGEPDEEDGTGPGRDAKLDELGGAEAADNGLPQRRRPRPQRADAPNEPVRPNRLGARIIEDYLRRHEQGEVRAENGDTGAVGAVAAHAKAADTEAPSAESADATAARAKAAGAEAVGDEMVGAAAATANAADAEAASAELAGWAPASAAVVSPEPDGPEPVAAKTVGAEAVSDAEREADFQRETERTQREREHRLAEEARRELERRQAETVRREAERRRVEEARRQREQREAEEARREQEQREAREARREQQQRRAEEARRERELREAEEQRRERERLGAGNTRLDDDWREVEDMLQDRDPIAEDDVPAPTPRPLFRDEAPTLIQPRVEVTDVPSPAPAPAPLPTRPPRISPLRSVVLNPQPTPTAEPEAEIEAQPAPAPAPAPAPDPDDPPTLIGLPDGLTGSDLANPGLANPSLTDPGLTVPDFVVPGFTEPAPKPPLRTVLSTVLGPELWQRCYVEWSPAHCISLARIARSVDGLAPSAAAALRSTAGASMRWLGVNREREELADQVAGAISHPVGASDANRARTIRLYGAAICVALNVPTRRCACHHDLDRDVSSELIRLGLEELAGEVP